MSDDESKSGQKAKQAEAVSLLEGQLGHLEYKKGQKAGDRSPRRDSSSRKDSVVRERGCTTKPVATKATSVPAAGGTTKKDSRGRRNSAGRTAADEGLPIKKDMKGVNKRKGGEHFDAQDNVDQQGSHVDRMRAWKEQADKKADEELWQALEAEEAKLNSLEAEETTPDIEVSDLNRKNSKHSNVEEMSAYEAERLENIRLGTHG